MCHISNRLDLPTFCSSEEHRDPDPDRRSVFVTLDACGVSTPTRRCSFILCETKFRYNHQLHRLPQGSACTSHLFTLSSFHRLISGKFTIETLHTPHCHCSQLQPTHHGRRYGFRLWCGSRPTAAAISTAGTNSAGRWAEIVVSIPHSSIFR
jgi:hypothetical protein